MKDNKGKVKVLTVILCIFVVVLTGICIYEGYQLVEINKKLNNSGNNAFAENNNKINNNIINNNNSNNTLIQNQNKNQNENIINNSIPETETLGSAYITFKENLKKVKNNLETKNSYVYKEVITNSVEARMAGVYGAYVDKNGDAYLLLNEKDPNGNTFKLYELYGSKVKVNSNVANVFVGENGQADADDFIFIKNDGTCEVLHSLNMRIDPETKLRCEIVPNIKNAVDVLTYVEKDTMGSGSYGYKILEAKNTYSDYKENLNKIVAELKVNNCYKYEEVIINSIEASMAGIYGVMLDENGDAYLLLNEKDPNGNTFKLYELYGSKVKVNSNVAKVYSADNAQGDGDDIVFIKNDGTCDVLFTFNIKINPETKLNCITVSNVKDALGVITYEEKDAMGTGSYGYAIIDINGNILKTDLEIHN